MNIHRRRRETVGRPGRARADAPLWTLMLTVVAGALLALTTGLCAFSELEQFGPSLGSIVVFRAVAGTTEWWHIDTRIIGASGRACILSPAAMGSGGGSLIVEARQLTSPPAYRVHWAGKQTAAGSNDCGGAADLLLSRSELMRLADVAGGFNTNLRMVDP